jgi:hypothetical protein
MIAVKLRSGVVPSATAVQPSACVMGASERARNAACHGTCARGDGLACLALRERVVHAGERRDQAARGELAAQGRSS